MATDHPNSVELPERLRGQFAALNRRLWKIETLASFCLAAVSLLISLLALFFSDRLWESPVWLRVACLAIGLAGLAWFGLIWIKLWVVHRRDQRALARLVQRQYRRLGDRLLGIVELADEKQRPTYFSPALYRAAIEQVATEATAYKFSDAVDARPARRARRVLAALIMVMFAVLWLAPGAGLNALHRWVAPTASIPRVTLVALEGLPKERVVAHGESFVVRCSVRYHSFWKPRRAVCQIEAQNRILAAIHGDQVQVQLPGQVQNGILHLRVGDARAEVFIRPTYRPSLTSLAASVQSPAYLQYPITTQKVENASMDVLEGSRVAFHGTLSRAAAAAQWQAAGQSAQALEVQDQTFSSQPIDLAGVSELAFSWRDRLGLENAAPWRLQIHSQIDSPPTPELVDLQKDTAILQSEVLPIKMLGRDDFGVREIGLEWQLLSDMTGTNGLAQRPYVYKASNPREKTLEDTYYFSPSLMLIPPDSVVELRGSAVDFYPDREPSQTPVYRIHVLGNEQHAELVRQSLESILTRLEEVTRLEEKVAASTRQLQELPKDKLNSDQAGGDIASAQQDQNQNASNLNQLAQEAKNTVREAARNPTFSEDTLRDWAKNLQQMQQLSDEKMQQAAQSLKSAQQDANSRSQNLGQAAQKEQEILEALEQMQRKINKGLDQLQALTLAQRLRKISADEKGLADGLQRIVPEIIGMFPKELSSRFRNTESFLAGEQESAHKETEGLQGEIGRFFERTQKAPYGQVHKEMTETRVTDELDRVRGLIEENVAMDAMQNLLAWSDRLKGWADLLEPKSDSSGGGGGGEGGSNDESLLKTLLGLLRVRDREINLRQQTTLLEKSKAAAETYGPSAKSLARTQGQIHQDLGKIQSETPVPALEFPLQQAASGMEGVEGLLNKPQTDRETELAQTKTIEQLSDVINLINEQQQRRNNRNSSQSASAEEMAFLMQMMALQNPGRAMTTSPRGGGSQAGGTTDRAATPMLGDPNGQAGEARNIRRAGGSTANLPTEFREALEDYFKGVEKLERKP